MEISSSGPWETVILFSYAWGEESGVVIQASLSVSVDWNVLVIVLTMIGVFSRKNHYWLPHAVFQKWAHFYECIFLSCFSKVDKCLRLLTSISFHLLLDANNCSCMSFICPSYRCVHLYSNINCIMKNFLPSFLSRMFFKRNSPNYFRSININHPSCRFVASNLEKKKNHSPHQMFTQLCTSSHVYVSFPTRLGAKSLRVHYISGPPA